MFHSILRWNDLIFMKWIQAEYQHIDTHKSFEKTQNNLEEDKKLDFMTQWLILITLIATMKGCSMRHWITEEMTCSTIQLNCRSASLCWWIDDKWVNIESEV